MMHEKEKLVSEIVALVEKLAEEQEMPVEPEDLTIELLTIRECTEVIHGLSMHTVRQLISQGKLPSVRTGQGRRGKILVNKADLLAYFQRDA